jgi:PAS domain S-box-containing protein
MKKVDLFVSSVIALAGFWFAFSGPTIAWICFCMVAIYWFIYGLQVNKKLRHVSQKYGIGHFRQMNQTILALDQKIAGNENQLTEMIDALEKIGKGEKVENSSNLTSKAGQSVLLLEQKLGLLKEEEIKRMWVSDGLARINEIRKKQNAIEEYAFDNISSLIKHMNANQGCFYLLNETENGGSELQLLATYAYNKRKFTEGTVRVDVGTGLLGQSVLEKDLIFIKDLPKNYIKITSGLGEALPRSIVIMPLIFREKVYGVVEMASFHEFESHHFDFIRKVGGVIAAELSGMREHEHTLKLLEKSQSQAIELQKQEEAMLRSMERIIATEEEMKRKESQLQKQLNEAESERQKNDAILNGCMDGVISFNDNGTIVFANKVAQEIFERSHSEILGKQIGSLLQLHIHENVQGMKIVNRNGNEITTRTEVTAENARGEELSLLLTAAKVNVEDKVLFTLFIQKISVDLF